MIAGQIVVIDTGLRDAFEPNANRNDRLIRARRERDFPCTLSPLANLFPGSFKWILNVTIMGGEGRSWGDLSGVKYPTNHNNFEGCTVRRYAVETRDSGTSPNPEAIDEG
jgi:hypothetical protein